MTQQEKVLDKLRQNTLQIVDEMVEKHLVEYMACTDENSGTDFRVLTTPDVVKKHNILLIISGAPEETGAWSYTLLSRGRTEETSMKSYFKMAHETGWGMIALNPHGKGKEEGREEYFIQLETVLRLLNKEKPGKNIMLFCFSAGGSVAIEFLNNHPELAENVQAMLLVDTTPPPLTKKMLSKELKTILTNTFLFGLQDTTGAISSWATITSSILGIEPKPVMADLHGEMPEKVKSEVKNKMLSFRRDYE